MSCKERVQQCRDSYRNVGLNLDKVESEDPVASLRKRTSLGTAGNLGLDRDRAWLSELSGRTGKEAERLSGVYARLIPGIAEAVR